VAVSDAAVIDEVVVELAKDFTLPRLTCTKVNLGKFAVTKVMFFSWILIMSATHANVVSYKIFPSEYTTVPQSVLISRPSASGVKSSPF
jgi:hypothetical protein